MDGRKWVGLKIDTEQRKKRVLFLPSFSVRLSKRIQIWDGRQKVALEIQKSLCRGRNKDNLVESTCFI